MNSAQQIADCITQMVQSRNRTLIFDATLKASLGIAFSTLTFGFIFWIGWMAGFCFFSWINLEPWQFAALVTGIFLGVAIWSAWVRVNPLADLAPLSDRDLFLTLVSQAAGGLGYFSPRHASAGFAVILIGGPAGVFEALGIWAHRIRADAPLIEQASKILALCEAKLPAEKVRVPAAALLLRRLALIKVVPNDDSVALMLTEHGFAVLSGGKGKRAAGKAKRKSD